ncbi:hypothetical protein D3C72_2472950 [compost metagenome]
MAPADGQPDELAGGEGEATRPVAGQHQFGDARAERTGALDPETRAERLEGPQDIDHEER